MVKSLLLIQYIIIQIKRASIRIFQTLVWEFSDIYHRNPIRVRQYSFFNVPNNLI
ncbi:hypothetical protein M486_272 [Yersinia pestis 1045]|uniref:Uncharacterized protein n=1 Tax=Yersinia pestis TaxID=632 RepID=A0AAX2I3I6_YERPE|nr:hypothetical protein CH59_3444 [Yersinia pestis]AJI98914.1 hypothetical protein BZ18_4016 [Yersinia pestis Pestoides F]AJJ77093.1 hypothetical protein CH57_621 [Yersinia pestis A1122]AJJ80933.1 hypothetical protein CH58_1111 [Yersinia pestis Antiqua]AJJ84412.1 hypothetical protein CH56_2763 [Yersinia pestis Angola]AJK11317.1 hypothetical protein CH60_1052 [Yersinia pestis str. Pestoides B]AJK23090.1 hypothetical protein CH43_4088 [Yersinia pestis Pestoides G]AKS59648.1 hypothetical protei